MVKHKPLISEEGKNQVAQKYGKKLGHFIKHISPISEEWYTVTETSTNEHKPLGHNH